MATYQSIITAAFSKSAAARPEVMTTSGELLTAIYSDLQDAFLKVAQENPYALGTAATVVFDVNGWPYPDDLVRLIGVRATASTVASPAVPSGATIALVPFNDPALAAPAASLVEFGRQLQSAGNATDPTGGELQVLYARAPIQPTAITDPVDPLLPVPFYDIIIYGLAAYLAAKDEREADLVAFRGVRDAMVQQWLARVRLSAAELVQRFPVTVPGLGSQGTGVPVAQGQG